MTTWTSPTSDRSTRSSASSSRRSLATQSRAEQRTPHHRGCESGEQMNDIVAMVASSFDLELRRLVFPESESPVYRFEVVTADGAREAFTWTPQEGVVVDSRQAPTAVIELRQEALESLLSGEY